MVCEQVYAAVNYSQIDGYLKGSDDLLQLDFTEYETVKTAVEQALVGQDFATYGDLVTAFGAAVATAVKDIPKPPGTGGSVSTGGLGGGTVTNTIVVNTEETAEADTSVQDAVTQPVGNFDDLEGYAWAENYINALYEKGILAGKGGRTFAPGDSITRAEFAKLMVCAFEVPERTYDGFADVAPEDWYYPYVGAAYAKGMIQGIGGGLFGANDVITRQDACVIAWRTLQIQKGEGTLNFLDKADIADYALEAVAGLSQMGVLSGNEKGEFLPNNNMNRAEAAKVICGLLKEEVK